MTRDRVVEHRGRPYPAAPAGPFPEPPLSFTDADGRSIDVRRYGGEFEATLEMYRDFDPRDRAQGIPPVTETRLRSWLEQLASEGLNVLAWHEDRVVGHASLAPESATSSELAIFVLGGYQGAGIGTRLIQALLGLGRAGGVRWVWLVVQRFNTPAVRLYRKVGFMAGSTSGCEMEMTLRLA